MREPIELAIWKEIAGLHMSVSHDRWHIDRVLEFAYALHGIYGGDREILTAAVLMHDLGRGDEMRPHGLESIVSSTEQAAAILKSVGYPAEKSHLVLQAIAEHDQPEVTPSSIEGKILKDADFLAGFGAWGILRIAMWSGETHRNMSVVLDRLEFGMARRLANLGFPASVEWARREMVFARLFLEKLRGGSTAITQLKTRGLYIVLEGISGSGKDTQAKMLEQRLRGSVEVRLVSEPHSDWRVYRNAWRHQHHSQDPPEGVTKWLMMAARESTMVGSVQPALDQNAVVISIRSFLSTLVYQCTSDEEVAETAFAHSRMPQPDLVLLLDLPIEEALRRIGARDKEPGIYETAEQLAHHRDRFKNICQQYVGSRLQVVDAAQSVEALSTSIWEAIVPLLDGLQNS